MPWQQRSILEQRQEFVIRAVKAKESMTALCEEYGISRPTGYLWVKRYKERESLLGLVERSRRPNRSPKESSSELIQRITEVRKAEGWGARKLRILLKSEGTEVTEIT